MSDRKKEIVKIAKLLLDTRDAIKIPDTSNVRFDNLGKMTKDIREGSIRWVRVMRIEMPNTFYNIINSNNTFEIEADDGVVVRTIGVQIPIGHYDIDELIALIQSELTAADVDSYTITRNSITDKLSITNSGTDTISVNITGASTMLDILGFTETTAFANTIEGDRQFNTAGIKSIMIKSNLVDSNIIRYSGNDGQNLGFIAELKNNAAYGGTIIWENSDPHDLIYVNRLPQSLEIQLRNRKSVIESNNNFDYRIMLMVAYV